MLLIYFDGSYLTHTQLSYEAGVVRSDERTALNAIGPPTSPVQVRSASLQSTTQSRSLAHCLLPCEEAGKLALRSANPSQYDLMVPDMPKTLVGKGADPKNMGAESPQR